MDNQCLDEALKLRIAIEGGQVIEKDEVLDRLKQSELLKVLTTDFPDKDDYLFAIWRLTALSEIPFSSELEYTKKLIDYINRYLYTDYGYSYTGNVEDLVPCYNAMIAEAMLKMGINSDEVAVAINWIKNFQSFERGFETTWKYKGILKHGGCLHSTPCYIGLVKSLKALVWFNKFNNDEEAKILQQKGIEYMLNQKLFKRLHDGQPIYNHILDLSFPASYQLNIVEILETMYLTHNLGHVECMDAIHFVNNKKQKEGYWKINYIYKSKGYISFDKRGQKAEWLTYLLSEYLK